MMARQSMAGENLKINKQKIVTQHFCAIVELKSYVIVTASCIINILTNGTVCSQRVIHANSLNTFIEFSETTSIGDSI